MPLFRVGVEQILTRPSLNGRRKLPAEIYRVADAGIQFLPSQRRVIVRASPASSTRPLR